MSKHFFLYVNLIFREGGATVMIKLLLEKLQLSTVQILCVYNVTGCIWDVKRQATYLIQLLQPIVT